MKFPARGNRKFNGLICLVLLRSTESRLAALPELRRLTLNDQRVANQVCKSLISVKSTKATAKSSSFSISIPGSCCKVVSSSGCKPNLRRSRRVSKAIHSFFTPICSPCCKHYCRLGIQHFDFVEFRIDQPKPQFTFYDMLQRVD